jgi:hypothetical protein
MAEKPYAIVRRDAEGRLVLDDPIAVSVGRAVSKHNCRATLLAHAERVRHFETRVRERGLSPKNVVIVVLNVDDIHGGPLAEALMPGHDWQEYRDRGEVPFARGLAVRGGIEDVLGSFDKEAHEKLTQSEKLSVVVVDHGVAEVFPVVPWAHGQEVKERGSE